MTTLHGHECLPRTNDFTPNKSHRVTPAPLRAKFTPFGFSKPLMYKYKWICSISLNTAPMANRLLVRCSIALFFREILERSPDATNRDVVFFMRAVSLALGLLLRGLLLCRTALLQRLQSCANHLILLCMCVCVCAFACPWRVYLWICMYVHQHPGKATVRKAAPFLWK